MSHTGLVLPAEAASNAQVDAFTSWANRARWFWPWGARTYGAKQMACGAWSRGCRCRLLPLQLHPLAGHHRQRKYRHQ